MSSRRFARGLALIVLLVVAGLGATWFFVLRDTTPPPVSLTEAVASIASPTPEATTSAAVPSLVSKAPGGTETIATPSPEAPASDSTPTASQPSGDEPAPPPATATGTPAPVATQTATPTPTPTPQANGLVGEWVISDQGESFVGYRVREELARVGFKTAVGRTTAVTASMFYDGQSITQVSVVADMTQLKSDDDRRENHLKSQSLQTNLYPTATLVLVAPITVGEVSEGASLSATALGDLTIHGVTQRVAIDLHGQLVDGLVVIVGSLEIQFADYDIDTPDSGLVLSVEDHGIMELQLVFEHA